MLKAVAAFIWLNVSSTQPNGVHFVGVFAVREIVETVVDFCVGSESGQNGVEVCVIGAVHCVVSSTVVMIITEIEEVLWTIVCAGLSCEICYEKETTNKGK